MTVDRAGHAIGVRSRTAGFTLIEVLAALAISGLCLMVLSGIVGRLATTQHAMRDHAEVLDQGDAVIRLLRHLLRSVDVEMRDATGPNLSGQGLEFAVRSQGPAVLDLEAQTTFRFHFVPPRDPARGASGALALAWTNPTTGASFDETVATGVSALELGYRAKGDEGWVGSWTKPVADLALVRIGITFASSHGAVPMAAIVAVGTRLPQACVVDPLLDRCPQW